MTIGITGTGSYIPSITTPNEAFETSVFLQSDGVPFEHSNKVIIQKFQEITGIDERRYAENELNTSDLGYQAAKNAIADSGIDPEDLDYALPARVTET